MNAPDEAALNPWVSMWTKPRETIQQIVDSDPTQLVLALAVGAGISNALDRAYMREMGDHYELPILLVIVIFAGIIGGIVMLYLGAALIRWTGTWIGGEASSVNIRAAIAWGNVPLIWGLLLWIPQFALLGDEVFKSQSTRLDSSDTVALAILGVAVAEIVVGIWALVVMTKTVGQVQGFSAWKALGNLLLAALVVAVPIFVLAFAMSAAIA